MRTDKTSFTDKELLKIIEDYEMEVVPHFDKLWHYYQGKNDKILNRKMASDATSGGRVNSENTFSSGSSNKNTPDNLVPIPYGRKIITTFTGYAYRPKYITYKPIEVRQELEYLVQDSSIKDVEFASKEEIMKNLPPETLNKIKKDKEAYIELMKCFRLNNEHIKTSRAGRNTGIFGVSYELLYTTAVIDTKNLKKKAEVKFITVDPREMILLYDFDSDPKKVCAIRFYRVTDDVFFVEVYYKDRIEKWQRTKNQESRAWEMKLTETQNNFFGEIPVVAFYFGDEMIGLIEPVIPLIDCYDILISDSMNEFDRFANAYLILKKMSLVDPVHRKVPGAFAAALANLKRYRVFENVDEKAEIKFLTKDIPHEYIQFMSAWVQKQIHTQSHVPDFAGEKFTGASGIAIQRLLFDFENVCSDAEADFDVALYERMRMIYSIYNKLSRVSGGDYSVINIAHKRNSPLNLKEFADTAVQMKAAGFSSYLVADIMPDDVIPDVEEELERQRKQAEDMFSDVEQDDGEPTPKEDEDVEPDEGDENE